MAQQHPKHALPIGFPIGGFAIVRLVGQGGFGLVYEALNPDTGERVAIKEFYPSAIATRHGSTIVLNDDREADLYANVLERFRSTAVLQYKFDHPNILKVRNYIRDENTGYMITDYVDGDPLRSVLQPFGGHVPSDRMFQDVFRPIVAAVGYVHARPPRGYLHRDISPDNIMVDRFGKPVLIDFGALKRDLHASHTFSSVIFVREDFSPPEQLDRSAERPEGFYTDIFALAGTMYYALAGEPPMRASSRAFQGDPYVPIAKAAKIACPPQVCEAIDRGLKLPLGARPQSIAEFQAMLGWDDGRTLAVPPSPEPPLPSSRLEPLPPPPPPVPPPRRPPWLGYGLIAAAALIIGLVFALRPSLVVQEHATSTPTPVIPGNPPERPKTDDPPPRPLAYCDQAEPFNAARNAAGPEALRAYLQRCGSGLYHEQALAELEGRLYAVASSCIRTWSGCNFDGCVQLYTTDLPGGPRAAELRRAAADAGASPSCRPVAANRPGSDSDQRPSTPPPIALIPRPSEQQPSFNCAKAKEPVEHLICADAELTRWDARLGRAFERRKRAASNQRAVMQDEVAWLKRRDAACSIPTAGSWSLSQLAPFKPCILEQTRARISELEAN